MVNNLQLLKETSIRWKSLGYIFRKLFLKDSGGFEHKKKKKNQRKNKLKDEKFYSSSWYSCISVQTNLSPLPLMMNWLDGSSYVFPEQVTRNLTFAFFAKLCIIHLNASNSYICKPFRAYIRQEKIYIKKKKSYVYKCMCVLICMCGIYCHLTMFNFYFLFWLVEINNCQIQCCNLKKMFRKFIFYSSFPLFIIFFNIAQSQQMLCNSTCLF